jgi:3-hydroxy-9,10-secoandrosta-1,3,5(10)-triene-9,17-dione monooxygenase
MMLATGPRFRNPYAGQRISREEAIDRAKTIAPVAAANAEKAEKLRRMPEENIDAIVNSGLMPLMRPKRYGGYEGDWITHIDCVSEVAKFCGSTGWCMSFLIQHQVYLSFFPKEAQDCVYERHPDPRIVTAFAPTGKAKEVLGGFEIQGEWPFGSAGDYCDWAIVGGMVPSPDGGEPAHRMFLVKPGEFSMKDEWYSVGLKGSGSNTIVVREPLFVPFSFTYDNADAQAGHPPGSLVHDWVLCHIPLALNSSFAIMTPMHGIARGAFESFVEFTRDKPSRFGQPKAAENYGVQTKLGEAAAEIDAAYLITEKMIATVFEGFHGEIDKVRNRRDLVYVTRLLKSAVDRLFDMAGARGLKEGVALQRHWRDIHAICNHAVFNEVQFQAAGRAALAQRPAAGEGLVV